MHLKTLTAAPLILAFALTACVDAPDTIEAKIPETKKVTEVASIDAAIVNKVTRIGGSDLYEITPVNDKELTCFMLSSIFKGKAASGGVECIKGKAIAGGTLTIEASTKIGANTFYEITPATRPDLNCYIRASIYNGSIKCMNKTTPSSYKK